MRFHNPSAGRSALSPLPYAQQEAAVGRDDVGSKLSAASGRRSEVSEWPRSKLGASAARQRGNFGHRNRVIVPYGNAARAAVKRGVEDAAPYTKYLLCQIAEGCVPPRPLQYHPRNIFPPFFPQKGLTAAFFWHTINILRASQSLPPAGGEILKSFFTATCAWGKIPLRLPVWNLFACGEQIMRAADCNPFGEKTKFFRQQYYHLSLPFSSGKTNVSASMATSSMESSGSKVVKFCSHIPGADSARVKALSWRPTKRLNS